jgi:biotin carboxyl carrier protein
LKLAVEIDGRSCTLEIQRNGTAVGYTLNGSIESSGIASITELMPGVFSVLLDTRSFEVRIIPSSDALEVWIGSERHTVSISDLRDRSTRNRKIGASGPVELRAQMPGKVVTVLVELGAAVQAGQGLIVVEAMKMQNEMKSPKNGVVSKIHAAEGATVAAGQPLLVVE